MRRQPHPVDGEQLDLIIDGRRVGTLRDASGRDPHRFQLNQTDGHSALLSER